MESWSSCCWSLRVTEQVALNQGVGWGERSGLFQALVCLMCEVGARPG